MSNGNGEAHSAETSLETQTSQEAPKGPLLWIVVPSTGQISTSLVAWLHRQKQLDYEERQRRIRALQIEGSPVPDSLQYPRVEWNLVRHNLAGYVEDVRQAICDAFLYQSSSPWLLMIDSDTIPRLPAWQILEGAETAKVKCAVSPTPFHLRAPEARGIGANVFMEAEDAVGMYTLLWHKMPWEKKERYQKIDSAGFGCTLLHRDILETLVIRAARGEEDWPFRGIWRCGRVLVSEDLAFWARVRRAGYTIYMDLDNACSHDKRFTMSPQQAIDDLPFHDPVAVPHPDAPSEIPKGATVVPTLPDSALPAGAFHSGPKFVLG